MSKKKDERQFKIRQLLQEHPKIKISDLADYFQTSSETIRKDIIELEDSKIIKKEHGLYGTEVGTALEEVGGEGVAQGVGGDGAGDAGTGGQHLYGVEHGDAREVLAAAEREEEVVVLARFGGDVATVVEPELQLAHGTGRHGHETLFGAFAYDVEEGVGGVDVGEGEVAEFADAQTAAVKKLDDGAVAVACGFGEVDGGLECVDLGYGEHGGEVGRAAWHFEHFGGVGGDDAL